MDEAALDVLGAPGRRHDVMVVKLIVLGDIPAHPVTGALEDKQVEDAVIDRRASLGLLTELKAAEAGRELRASWGNVSAGWGSPLTALRIP